MDETMHIEIMRPDEVAKELGVSTRTIRRWVVRKEFPEPGYIGPRRRGWRADTIRTWIAKCLNPTDTRGI